jgi:hypothetical protein
MYASSTCSLWGIQRLSLSFQELEATTHAFSHVSVVWFSDVGFNFLIAVEAEYPDIIHAACSRKVTRTLIFTCIRFTPKVVAFH